MRPQGNQQAKGSVSPGKVPALDKLLQRLFGEFGLEDRVMRAGLLWYPDGDSDAVPHRHDCCTALLSFGAPRILTIDKPPILLRDGDLIIFGTQRHGVPKLPDNPFDDQFGGGRVSVPIFYMPNEAQMKASWQTLTS